MRSIVVRAAVLAAACLAPLASAQTAQSPNYQLADFDFDCGGGGASTPNATTWGSVGMFAGGFVTSPNYQAEIGVLASNDVGTSNQPLVFAVTPAFGPKSGGQVITVSGFNFDKLGSGASAAVFIGGVACTSVNVVSNTTLTAVTPAGGPPGPQTVTVSNVLGADDLAGGYVNTPAIVTTPAVALGDTLHIVNYGPVGAAEYTFLSTQTQFVSTPYGPFLVGPAPLVILFAAVPYAAPDGINDVGAVVPMIPALHDLVVDFQSFALTNPSPAAGSFTNLAQSLLQ